MALQGDFPFPKFSSSPLHLQQWDVISKVALKNIPLFYGNGDQSPIDHIHDVVNHYVVHDVMEDIFCLILLVASFKGKAKYWYNILVLQSISIWNQLGEQLDN